MSHEQQPVGLIKERSDSSHTDVYPVNFSLHVGGFRQKSMMAKKEAVVGNVEKHCGMISGRKEIP